MNRSALYITLTLALALSLTASLLVFKRLNQSGPKPRTPMIVVAAKDFDVGASLTADDLKLVRWTSERLPKGAFTRIADAAGRAVLYPTFETDAIIEAKLAPTGSGAGLPA